MHFGLLSIFQNYRDEHDDGEILRAELALAKLADRLGYASYWAPEHHFFGYSMCPDNLQWLAQVAGCTEKIRLGPAAVIMPWNDPYRVAAKMALLDSQTGGRALLGFGRGLSRREYERFGISMDEARGRFDQGTALVLEALNKRFFEADTEYFRHPRAELRPRPIAMGLETLAEVYAGVNTFGTPDEIVQQLHAQKDVLGCDHDLLVIPKYGSMTQEEAEASVSLFAREVIPRFN